ncbi:MAG TPA: sortase [Vitreimonas sp.]|nr:sortase [Vitreimonas sp.]
MTHPHFATVQRSKGPAWLWPLIIACLVIVFLIWLFLTYVPVLIVETKYQSRQLLSQVFNVTDIREIFIPNFEALGFRGASKYKDYGIVIPAIYLDEPVVFNVDPNDQTAYTAALKQGIAHASGTAFPDNPGIGYYFAHSSNPEFRHQYNAVFYLLGKLKPQDEIFIWHENEYVRYVVSTTKITEPEDVSFLNQPADAETIVLQTCWPPGTTQKRLLVFAQRERGE